MDQPKLSFARFKRNWENNYLPNKPAYIRKGQSLMNYLSTVWFEEYNRISSCHYYDETNIDCFYNDGLIENTLQHLEKTWKIN
jgi:hypothetical protein